MNSVPAKYYPKRKTLRIKALSTQFYPAYFKYVLIALNIPDNTKLVFLDKTFENITVWLNQKENKNESKNL